MATFEGLELLLEEPNGTADITDKVSRKMFKWDYNIGKVGYDYVNDSPRYSKELTWLLDGRAAIDTFKTMVAARKGKLVPFWVPSWRADLLLKRSITLEIPSRIYLPFGYYGATYNLHRARSRVIFFKQDKSYFIKKINTSGVLGTEEYLEFDSPFTVAYGPDDFAMISYLVLCRLDTDKIEWQWETPSLVTVRLPIIEIPQEVTI